MTNNYAGCNNSFIFQIFIWSPCISYAIYWNSYTQILESHVFEKHQLGIPMVEQVDILDFETDIECKICDFLGLGCV